MENKQRATELELKRLLGRYNVLQREQIFAYFAREGREQFAGKALRKLEKEREICIHPELGLVAANEEALSAREHGTLQAFWVLLGIMGQREVEDHFLASREEYPVRIIFTGGGEIFDILYVSEDEIPVVNNLFRRKQIDSCGHIVTVEKPEDIPKLCLPEIRGFCTVKEGGKIEYYKKEE